MLDIRNTDLVNDGRQALDKIEKNEPFNVLEIRQQDNDRKKKCCYFFFWHSLWLRLILSLAFAFSMMGAFYSLHKLNLTSFIITFHITSIMIIFIVSAITFLIVLLSIVPSIYNYYKKTKKRS